MSGLRTWPDLESKLLFREITWFFQKFPLIPHGLWPVLMKTSAGSGTYLWEAELDGRGKVPN